MTVITRVSLEQGSEPDWDTAMRDRMATAESADGWINGQILIPLERPDARVIIGVWETRSAWEAWHNDPVFRQTRERMAAIRAPEGETTWHEVVYDARS